MVNRFWVTSALLALSHTAVSSGFLLHEQNASGLGEFYAGAGAIAEDASTNYYNPAGMVLLPGTQFSVSGVWVGSDFNFDGDVVYGTPLLGQPPYVASGDANAGTDAIVPAFHVTHQFTPKIAAGISLTAPFGLSTEYDKDSIARYQALLSDLKTYNLSPSVAYKVVPWLSLAAGFDVQYAEVDITSAANYQVLSTPNVGTDAESKNFANSWAWGWHAGALAIIDKKSRVGLNFRSNFEHEFEGTSKYEDPNFGTAESDVSGTIDFPWLIDLSGVHVFDSRWTVLGSVSYIHWSSITKLQLDNVSLLVPAGGGSSDHILVTSVDDLNFKNTWSAFGGLRYQLNPIIMLKVGGGYDQSPTNNDDRDLRLPDSDRWIASTGIRASIPKTSVFLDLGYAHIWGKEADIDKDLSESGTTNTTVGHVTAHADLVGAQISFGI